MNIKDNLLQMKDMTELMLDLAYSSVFLKDKAIADKVRDMHKQISMLEESTLKMLFKIRESDDARMFILDLTDHMKDIANAALRIADLSQKNDMPPIVKDILSESEQRVISVKISQKSPYANRTIGENLVRSTTRATIIGIKRDNRWIFSIDRNMKLLPNDDVIAVGTYKADQLFKKNAAE